MSKVAIITGAGGAPNRGMGRAIAEAMAAQGHRIVAADINAETAEQTAQLVRSTGGDALSVQVDVAVRRDLEHLVDVATEHFGRIDVLVNHVGLGDLSSVVDTDDEWWDRCLAVTLTAAFVLCRRIVPIMVAQGGGVILNTISVAGLAGGRAGLPYTVAKHGLVGLTRNIAVTHGDKGIRCVGICPGIVRSGDERATWDPRSNAVIATDRAAEQVRAWPTIAAATATSPRPGTPDEIAAVVAFMASDAASYVNGAMITVDGGWTAV